jgi:hypothetical protein
MERKVTWRTKGFKQYKNGSKGKTPGQAKKKKSRRGHGCLCCVCCKDGSMERKLTWRTKGFKQYKNGSKGKNPEEAKKKSRLGHGCLSLVSVVCCEVEVSATSWSLVQRSPTDCGVSQICVIMKPRRNEEAQAHIGLSSHRKKNIYMINTRICILLKPRNLIKWSIKLSVPFATGKQTREVLQDQRF